MTLKEARERAGLSKKDAAIMIGVIPQTITNWEEKGAVPRQVVLEEACKAYKVSVDQIDLPTKAAKPTGKQEDDEETVNAYEYGVGAPAPEHLPEDRYIIELEKAQDRIKFLEERLSFYEDSESGEIIGLRNLTEQYKQQITDYEEAAAVNEDRIRAQHKNIEQYRKQMLEKQKTIDDLTSKIRLLERRNIELKAEAYDLMKEKAELFKEIFAHYHEKEDSK